MPDVQVLRPREVPLGGPRSMTVRRTLPHRDRSFIGAWCFVDHYGPDEVASTGGMDVPPHPHTGLQTVSWLFEGEVEHRDSAGVHAMVRPGEVNLMTSGHGIAHSEVSTPETDELHGVQLWVVLPEADRELQREFQHHAAPLVPLAGGVDGRVFLGSIAGHTSPIRTQTPLLGVEVTLDEGATWTVDADPAYEHGLLVDQGKVTFDGTVLERGDLGIVDAGASQLTVTALDPTRAVLLGGTPYEESIVMWWNFIGRDHDEIVAFREQWQSRSERFGEVDGYAGRLSWLPAPELPGGRLRSRTRHGRH
ncbi:pirin family protein [Knoellia sp. Soil729]|uniref:pirin family protein n=1 Tax=Knoellia sp. Soil729 TaxID=1736394 RepID=UPI0006F32B8D|nr:pirin family protein [Knoellia sp. Soil729]KRE42676.1 pirin [Knoellia sp. Soil729]